MTVAPDAAWTDEGGAGAGLDLALKRSWSRGRSAMALQAGPTYRDGGDGGCEGLGAEARVLAGAAQPLALGVGFVTAEAAVRGGEGPCQGLRQDVTLGWDAGEGGPGLALLRLFRNDPEVGSASLKAQATFVWFIQPSFGIEVGARSRVDDDPGFAAVLGVWSRR